MNKGWSTQVVLKYNEIMKKIRDDQHNYGEAFDKGCMQFCKQTVEKALEKRPSKRKRSAEYIQIYSDNNIPHIKQENTTDEIREQIKITNDEIEV